MQPEEVARIGLNFMRTVGAEAQLFILTEISRSKSETSDIHSRDAQRWSLNYHLVTLEEAVQEAGISDRRLLTRIHISHTSIFVGTFTV